MERCAAVGRCAAGGRLAAVLLMLWAVAIIAERPIEAAIYNYTAVPDSADTYTTAQFRIYVPDQVAFLRGVYFYVDPYLSDSRYITADFAFKDLVGQNDFALMGARLDNLHMDSGSGDAVLEALEVFAGQSEHDELQYSALFMEGYSWGGQFSYHFTKWAPHRVIGFVTMKGGYHNTDPAGDAIYVPGYMFIGELDLDYRIENLTGIFEEHRPLGARWILAMQPNAGHSRVTDRNVLDDYYRVVIEKRLPESWNPEEIPALRVITEGGAWLGNRETHEIGYYPCYDADSGLASWCPRRSVADQWQGFVSDSTVTDTIPCLPAETRTDEPCSAHHQPKITAAPNPFTTSTTICLERGPTGMQPVTLFGVNGEVVRQWAVRQYGASPVFIRWDGRDWSGVAADTGVYFLRWGRRGNSRISTIRLVR